MEQNIKTVCDEKLVAFCGLYCGGCGQYKRGKCPGCADNAKATWCKVRACCIERKCSSCADCAEFSDPAECGKLNNFISKIFSFVFRSNRNACVRRIKSEGRAAFAREMAEQNSHSVKR